MLTMHDGAIIMTSLLVIVISRKIILILLDKQNCRAFWSLRAIRILLR